MHDLIRRAEAWLSSPEAMTAADDLISDLLAALKAQQPAPAGDDGLPPLPEPVAWFRAPYGTLEPNPLFRVTGPQALEWSVRCFTEHQFRQAQREAMAVERERYNTLFHAYSEVCADAAVRADEIERLTRELAELKSDRDSWIDQASQRAQETVEAMQQVEAYWLRCEAQDSAPREPLTDEQVDALWKEPMSADWEHREFARAIERAIASQPVAQRFHGIGADAGDDQGVGPLEKKVERLDAMLRAMQADMRTYLTPGSGCGADWFVSRMLWHLDGPQQRAAQGDAP